MDYTTGKMLEAIDEKLTFLVNKLIEQEEKVKKDVKEK